MATLHLRNARHKSTLIRLSLWISLPCLFIWACSILIFSYGVNEPKTLGLFLNQEKSWDSQVLHIVLTRFMQDQPNLVHLARARLLLFQTVCLPSMIQQSTSQFLWIILTDPNLDLEIRRILCEILKPYPNFFLLGTNRQIQGETFRSSLGQHFLQVQLFSGNIIKLRQAYLIRDSIPLLQTRLDADDALHKDFLEVLQVEAVNLFYSEKMVRDNLRSLVNEKNNHVQWYFWCTQRHVEWYANSDIWNIVEHSRLCVTPGLTVGMAPTSTYWKSSPPLDLAHDVLFKTLLASSLDCGILPCIRMIHEFPLGAVRTRTWTSAGMMNILLSNQTSKNLLSQEKIQKLCRLYFGIESLQSVQTYLHTHLVEIAQDNLRGQCTPGHSCKEKSSQTLQKMISKEERR
jgi:Putative rhamnosyl transferase